MIETIRALFGLGALVAGVTLVRLLAPDVIVSPGVEATLGLGTLLLGGSFFGTLAGQCGVPRITGYIAAGFVFGPGMASWAGYPAPILSDSAAKSLHVLDDVAIGIIAFKGGAELRWRELRPQLRAIGGILLGHALGAGLAVATVSYLALDLLGFDGLSGAESIAVAALLGTIAVAISPATVLAVRDESRAKGPVSDTALSTTILADVLVAVLFAVVAGGARAFLGTGGEGHGGGWLVAWELFGSLLGGLAVGVFVTLLLRYVRQERGPLLLACAVAAMVLARSLHLSGLLVALVAGAVVRNGSDYGDTLEHGLHRVSLPLYVLFFGLAGSHMEPLAIAATGWGLLLIPAARLGGLYLGTRVTGRLFGAPKIVQRRVWAGLIGQAGMTLALAAIVAEQFPGFGPRVYALALGVIAVHELFGPALFRRAIAASGEAGAADERMAPSAEPDARAGDEPHPVALA